MRAGPSCIECDNFQAGSAVIHGMGPALCRCVCFQVACKYLSFVSSTKRFISSWWSQQGMVGSTAHIRMSWKNKQLYPFPWKPVSNRGNPYRFISSLMYIMKYIFARSPPTIWARISSFMLAMPSCATVAADSYDRFGCYWCPKRCDRRYNEVVYALCKSPCIGGLFIS